MKILFNKIYGNQGHKLYRTLSLGASSTLMQLTKQKIIDIVTPVVTQQVAWNLNHKVWTTENNERSFK